jgi:hypothetical protein
MAEAFIYCWTDTNRNMLYVGTHKGTPDDGYVCSGKLMLEEYNKRPQDFKREVMAFGSYNDMINFETKILKATNAAEDKSFYNQHNGDGNFFNKGHTEATRAKLKIARNKRTDKPRLGKKLSEEGKIKASIAGKLRQQTPEGRAAVLKAGRNSAALRVMRLKTDPEFAAKYSESVKKGWETRRLRGN